jgi:addiction module HigA family antidote
MSRFADFLIGLNKPEARPVEHRPQRGDQRRQRMADAAVSLDDLRADAAALENGGVAPEAARPIHPGEILWEEFMKPLGLKAPTTAKAMGVPRTRIERLVAGQTALSPDTALRLSRAFDKPPMFWMNLQAAYDVEVVQQDLAKALAGIRPLTSRMAPA